MTRPRRTTNPNPKWNRREADRQPGTEETRMADDVPNMSRFRGEVIAGRYRLDRFLAEGAFGAVYQAVHLAYGREMRQVAVKIAKRPMSDREARAVFSEAIRLARLIDAAPDADTRQHFVMVHDAGRCGEGELLAGHPYLAMELVRGGSLARRLDHGPFPLARAIDYFDQILKAVAFMHSGRFGAGEAPSPIVHRRLWTGRGGRYAVGLGGKRRRSGLPCPGEFLSRRLLAAERRVRPGIGILRDDRPPRPLSQRGDPFAGQ
jgi:hypothetical protein